MKDTIFKLNETQKILFYSAMTAIVVQIVTIYFLIEEKKSFKFDKCLYYLFFSAIAYLFYYQIVIN